MALRIMHHYALQVTWLGEAYLLASRLDEAGAQAQCALDFAQIRQERGYEAYALRLLGEVAVHCEPPEAKQAEAHYRQALALAEELGMRPLQAHYHRGLGTLYLKLGRGEQERTHLSTATKLYCAMEMTFWMIQVETALARMGGA